MIRGRTLYHCHGSDKGKKIATYESHAKALEVHRAIMAREHADESPFRSVRKNGKRKR